MIKVCGMREPQNIEAVARLAPDMVGFIFYECSPRYAGGLPTDALDTMLPATRRVGVFVDVSQDYILETVRKYRLDFVQLHGAETPEMCARLKKAGHGVIKAFGVASREDVEHATTYEGVCDYFLFDTRSAAHGGTGRPFDHSLLNAYTGRTPYLLSGGLASEDAPRLASPKNPLCAGFDINSRFETAPGIKDPEAIKIFMETIKNQRQ